VPDHSTFSKYRHGKFRDGGLLRPVFEAVVARCLCEGLVGGHGLAVDASLIEADVDTMNSGAQEEWDVSATDPDDAPRAVREYLDVLNDKAFGASTPVKPRFTSHSDPAGQWTAARKGPAIFTYSNNHLIDTDHSVIVDVEATRSIRQAEVGAAQTMIDRTEERLGLKPDRLVADTAHGSAENPAWLTRQRSIIPFIPLIDKSERKDGAFSRSDFKWDEDNDRYICPEGKHLLQSRRNYSDPRRKEPKTGRRRYRATKALCDVCPSKPKCRPNTKTRFIGREKHEDARDFARLAAKADFNPKAQARRKKGERSFAHLKRILGRGRLRLTGPCGPRNEFTLAAIAQNLRKLAKLRPQATETRIAI